MAGSQGHRAALRGTLGVRGVQALGELLGYLGGADGWNMPRGCPSTMAGRQGCWVLQAGPNMTVFIHPRTDLSNGEVV